MTFQDGRQVFGIGITQVDNLGIAAGFQRCIEMSDQRAQAQARCAVAADQGDPRPCDRLQIEEAVRLDRGPRTARSRALEKADKRAKRG